MNKPDHVIVTAPNGKLCKIPLPELDFEWTPVVHGNLPESGYSTEVGELSVSVIPESP